MALTEFIFNGLKIFSEIDYYDVNYGCASRRRFLIEKDKNNFYELILEDNFGFVKRVIDKNAYPSFMPEKILNGCKTKGRGKKPTEKQLLLIEETQKHTNFSFTLEQNDITGYMPIVSLSFFLNTLVEYPYDELMRLTSIIGEELELALAIDSSIIESIIPFAKGVKLKSGDILFRSETTIKHSKYSIVEMDYNLFVEQVNSVHAIRSHLMKHIV